MLFCFSDNIYGHYVSSAGYTYHPPVAPVLSVADMIPPPPPPPGEGPLEGMLSYQNYGPNKLSIVTTVFKTQYIPDKSFVADNWYNGWQLQ